MPAISQSFRCFDEVARRGSIRQAAQTLHLTPAAVTQQILNLEETVGTPLFDRLPRGMQLTTAGEIMVASIRRSQRDYDNALSQVEDLRALRRGHINLGVSPSSAEQMIPRVMDKVMHSHPGLTFNVRTGNGETLLRWLANGEIDVAQCLRRVPPPGVEETRAWPQHMGVITAPGHVLARARKPLRLRDCLDFPLVLMAQDMELRMLADRIDPRLSRIGRPLLETSSVPLARHIVARTDAVAFLIPENVAQDVENKTLEWIGLEDAGARLHTCLYQRSGSVATVAMGLFLDAVDAAINGTHQRYEKRHEARLKAQAK